MIKFVLSIIGVILGTVGILYYLVNNSNFVPTNAQGEYLWVNIFVFVFLLSLALFLIIFLLVFLFRRFVLHENDLRNILKASFKYSLFFSLGLLVVFLLHVFHILNFLWGLGIFIIVLIAIFVI